MKTITLLITLLIFTACAPKNAPDPLQNSKKLILKGHVSLYNNGMLEIPYTTIKLIPAAYSVTDLSHKLFFMDARAALQQGIKDALDSVYIIPMGTKKAYEFSKDVYRVSDDLSDDIRKYTRSGGVWLIDKSSSLAKEHIAGAFSSGYQTGKDTYALGDDIEDFFDVASSDVLDSYWTRSKEGFNSSMEIASKINNVSQEWAREDFEFGLNSFVTGYAALPENLNNNLNNMGNSLTNSSFKHAYRSAELNREENSLYFTDIMSDTFSDYSNDTTSSFSKAGHNFGTNVEREGLILTSLKSMRWLLQGVFYDGLIKPLGQLSVGAVGFISVNGIIYPVEVLAGQTKATTLVIVEVSTQTIKSAYDIVAPSMTFAFASILSSTEYLGGKTVAAATAAVGATASAVDATTGLALSGTSKATGVVLGKSVKYIGVPIAVSARTVGEVSYGVLASSTSAVSGAGLLAGGEAAALTTYTTGTALSGTTLVAGTGYSVASAAAQGIYHLSEASVLPTGYALASGTVLGYGGISQLQAHTLLAATDAAYVVLSLEGPKWVLYSLSGDSINDNKALPAGAIVDLKKMHENNETIKKLAISDEEMEKVLDSLGEDLPIY